MLRFTSSSCLTADSWGMKVLVEGDVAVCGPSDGASSHESLRPVCGKGKLLGDPEVKKCFLSAR